VQEACCSSPFSPSWRPARWVGEGRPRPERTVFRLFPWPLVVSHHPV
jgi:hypothetical protein